MTRDSDTRRMAETGTGSGRSPGSAVPNGQSPNPQPVSEADLDALLADIDVSVTYKYMPMSTRLTLDKTAHAITTLRNQLTASEARERELRAELAQRPQWAGGQSPITCGPSGSAGGFRAAKLTSPAHVAVLGDLARRIDDE